LQKVDDWPRHFNLNKANNKILVACQNGSVVSEFSFFNGEIKQIGKKNIKTPSYVSYY
jgi:6-phosphogluconolactonase (cycloisomerase 2 family)